MRISLKKTRDYWKEGRGWLDGVEVTVINDGSARLNALISGQIDAINRVDHKAVALLSKTPKIQIVRAAGGRHAVMAMQCDKAPYDNPDIRMALKLATDREQILKALFSGYGTVGNDHPIPPTDPYFNKELPQRKYDPEKAAAEFKKAGIADPKILLQASDAAFNGAVDEGALLQASAAKAGIKVDLKKEPADGFWDNVWLKGAVRIELLGRPRGGDANAVGRLLRPARPGTRRTGTTRSSRSCSPTRAARPTRPSARPYIWEMQAMLQRARRRDHSRVQGLARRAPRQGRRAYAARRLRHGQWLHYAEGLDQGVTNREPASALEAGAGSDWPAAGGAAERGRAPSRAASRETPAKDGHHRARGLKIGRGVPTSLR